MLEIDSNGVVKASGDLAEFARKAKDAEEHGDGLKETIKHTNDESLKLAAGIAALTAGIYKLASAFVQFTKQNLAVFAHFEQMELGLSAMTGSAEKGKALFEELRVFSNKTTFGVDTLASATTQLLALGVAEDDVKDKLTQLGNIAGGSTEKFNRLVDVFVKIGAVGKASSIQLNQLSMITGVSWRKIMADMGVAKPTFDDISKAFAKLTAEGEKFHGRMDAIIDTIEGKEGFIRDTGDELRALFAEITGQADRYKSRLDLVYDIQYSVLQLFKGIANDEAAKNLISGVYSSGIILISTALTASLIPAIIQTGKQIKLLSIALKAVRAAFPTALVIGAFVTGIVAVVSAVRDATKETRAFKASLKELQSQMKELGELKGNENLGETERYWGERVQIYSSAIKTIKARILELKALNIDNNRSLEVERLERLVKDYEYELYYAENTYNVYKDQSAAEKDRLENLKQEGVELEKALGLINKIYGMSDEGKKALRIEELQGMIDTAERLLKANGTEVTDKNGVKFILELTDEQVKRTTEGIAHLREEITRLSKADEDNIELLKKSGAELKKNLGFINTAYGMSEEGKKILQVEELQKHAEILQHILDINNTIQYDEKTGKGFLFQLTEQEISRTKTGLSNIEKAIDNILHPKAPTLASTFTDEIHQIEQEMQRLYGSTKEGQIETLKNEIARAEKYRDIAADWMDDTEYNKANSILEMFYEKLEELVDIAKKDERKPEDYFINKDWLKEAFDQTEMGRLKQLEEGLARAMSELRIAEKEDNAERLDMAREVVREFKNDIKDFNKTATTLADKLKYGGFAAYASNIPQIFNELKTGREGLTIAGIKGGSVLGQVVGGIGLSALSKSQDAQDFVQGSIGGPVAGIINMIVGAFMRVAETCDGFSEAMNPVTELMKGLKPVIQIVIDLLKKANDMLIGALEPANEAVAEVAEAIKPLFEWLIQFSNIINIVTKGAGLLAKISNTVLVPVLKGVASIFNLLFGWVDDFLGSHNSKEEEDEKEILRQLNEEYKQLMQTMRENEQYYLERKRQLEAETYTKNVLGVNDMIITPQGKFSTHPDDTILAMKHPERLGSGEMKVIVNDYGGNNVDVQKTGLGELIINISKKVASDFASGKNGWDGAVASQQLRLSGRRVNA